MKSASCQEAHRLLRKVFDGLPWRIRRRLTDHTDLLVSNIEADLRIKALCDPSIGSVAEAASSGGCRALATYRVAHLIAVESGRPLARRMTDGTAAVTGIDIHYSAAIAPGVALDHAPVIIGETSLVAPGAYLAGATLGARRWPAENGSRRHPSIGEDSFVGPRALVLGPVTVAARCRIGAGAIVTSNLARDVVVGAYAVVKAPVEAEARIGFRALVLAEVPPGARVGDYVKWDMQSS